MLGSGHTLSEEISTDSNPTDSISCIVWSPDNTFLAVASWDSTIRVYQIWNFQRKFLTQKISMTAEDPILSLAWNTPNTLIAGSINSNIYLVNIEAQTFSVVGAHNDAVKDVYASGHGNGYFISLSYDKTLKSWDYRAQKEQARVELGSKIYCSDFDTESGKLGIGLSNDKVFYANCNTDPLWYRKDPQNYMINSPLGDNSPLSAIAISKHDGHVGVTSSDGRANISVLCQRNDGTYRLDNIVTFKCHKIDPGQGGNTSHLKILYPVHAIGFHPTTRYSFFTAGGEGNIHFWDSHRKDKISSLNFNGIPVTKGKLSPDGKYLAYGLGYDWGQGIQGYQSSPNGLFVHEIKSNELYTP